MKHTGDKHNAVFGQVFPHQAGKFSNVTAPSPSPSAMMKSAVTPPSTITKETISSTPTSSTTKTDTTMGHHGGHHHHHGGGGGFGWGGFYPYYGYPYPYYPAETIVLDTEIKKKPVATIHQAPRDAYGSYNNLARS